MRTAEYKRTQSKLASVCSDDILYWKNFDFSILTKYIHTPSKRGKGKNGITYADLIIMADTETSKKPLAKKDNHICAWSIAFRAFHVNIACLYGQDPWEFCDMLQALREALKCNEIYIYFHNLGYDWVFLRKFMFERFGTPGGQLNTKPYYPLYVKFNNGIILKDSLILAQRNLNKWSIDCDVEHKKAVGKWDYNKYRNQSDKLTDDELLYIANDVLAGVECIDVTLKMLNKNISSIPYTATGIVRGEAREAGRRFKAHDNYEKTAPDWKLQLIFQNCFHGGYTHANRYATVKGVNHGIYKAKCKDFSSSYPYVLLANKYPCEAFWKVERESVDPEYILKNMADYALIFKVFLYKVELKDKRFPMPCLSFFKAQGVANAVSDNGRILKADIYECYMTDIDFKLFYDQYKYEGIKITDIYTAFKDYLPRWFTDYIYKRYENKCTLKKKDPILYALEKAKLNSCFGMCAQRPVSDQIEEDYKTGEYSNNTNINYEEEYNKHVKNRNSFLPYVWGVYCTSYAQYNLFELGKCVPDNEMWLYSDTDSVYATDFDEEKVKIYNDNCVKLLKDRGYDPVEFNGSVYSLGIAEPEDHDYMQFKTIHSKCYCKREIIAQGDNFVMGGDLQITVAGVPKRGAKCLKNNIEDFKPYFKFDGLTTGKLTHSHIIVDDIYTDRAGNITGDSIDLSPCDYIMSGLDRDNLIENDFMEVEIPDYEDEYQLSFFNTDILSSI